MRKRTLLIVVAAPSGAGKTTLCERLLAERRDIVYSVSCTTRPPRGRERNGEDYFFLSEGEFEERMRRNEFLEHAVVYGYRYGTLKETVTGSLKNGNSVLMDIDVQGARQVRSRISGESAAEDLEGRHLDIFISPPSVEELRARLVRRGEDDAASIDERMRNAEREMNDASEFRYRIVNDDVDDAYRRFKEIIEQEERL